ncbi:MAG: hypothetical protein LBI05_10755 [Planctomycetaceae bacterium]|jgi:excisionase family DNA binding protein|nr:hypothetical protein [Planctomycetaceae bacterium]
MATNKGIVEYYNLEKVAEVLSITLAEVNHLREQSKLRGFRDGSNWKFNKEDVHTYLAESIKARSGNGNAQKPGDSGFDLAGDEASDPSFGILMDDAALPSDDQLVSATPVEPKSDVDLAALDQDSDLALAEETHVSSQVVPKKEKTPENPPQEFESAVFEVAMDDDDDSSALVLGSQDDGYDESVLSASGSSPQLGLAGESGFDMLVAEEGDGASEVLLVDDEKAEDVLLASEDFALEPAPKAQGDDDSESSSQVIAIDVGMAAEAQEQSNADDPFGGDAFGDFDGFGFDGGGVQATPAAESTFASDPFGAGTSSLPDAFTMPAAPVSTKKAPVQEEYSTGVLVSLVSALVVMLLCGIMLLDTMIHMWSWSDPFILNSMLMSPIANMFGL